MARAAFAVILAASFAAAAPASAAVVNFTTDWSGTFTLFEGMVQETRLELGGCPRDRRCGGALDLTVGAPQTAVTHFIERTKMGVNDGKFPGPDASFDAPVRFNFGAESITLPQRIRFRQIGNDQFMTEWSGSAAQTIDLAGIGRLELMLVASTGQHRSGNTGSSPLRTRFTLLSGVPEPRSWALMIGGFGLTGAALRARPRRTPARA